MLTYSTIQSRSPCVSIIVVSYNSRVSLGKCIRSLGLEKGQFELIVIDNASSDGTPSLLRNLDISGRLTRVLLNTENVGFGKACNQAVTMAHGKYLLFLNPDAVVAPDIVNRMATYLEEHSDVAMLGPKVLCPDGSLQLSCGREPTLRYRLFEAVYLPQLSARLFGGYRYWAWSHTETRDVDWLSASCLLVRAEIFRAVGGFDENIFLFEEDVDLCLRIGRAGHRVVYWPKVAVYHVQGQSSKTVRAFSLLTSYRSKLYLAEKRGRYLERVVLRFVFPVISFAKSIVAYGLAYARRDRRFRKVAHSHIRAAIALLRGIELAPSPEIDHDPVVFSVKG